MSITVRRKLEWDAGHRLLNHEGKCKYLHGHRYAAIISLQSQDLDPVGRVVDFGCIKNIIGGWIDANWDHNMLLNSEDELLKLPKDVQYRIFGDKSPYIFLKHNPTAENIAKELFLVAEKLLSQNELLSIVAIDVYETPNCDAIYIPESIGN